MCFRGLFRIGVQTLDRVYQIGKFKLNDLICAFDCRLFFIKQLVA